MEQSKQKNASFDASEALHEQNLKCPVCTNFYDTKDRAPHILHCLHSCCYACLRTRTRSEMVQCPVCTEVCEVPNNEIDVLPVDNARQHLVKFFKVDNSTQVCIACYTWEIGYTQIRYFIWICTGLLLKCRLAIAYTY